ncbi:MAG: PH domain-containing protein, partial [Patescibacteria group bacterium]|nr:PH domain-containing protein [Patescibacteria group bacterium]
HPRDAREQEEVLWEGGYSSRAMLGRWLFSGLATVASLIPGFIWPIGYVWLGIGVFVVVLWAYQVSVLFSRRMSVRYRLTSQRFVHESGILRRVTNRIDLIDIDDITFEQGVADRMVGVGMIRISSSDRTHPELLLVGIEDVVRVAGLIDETFRAERRRRGLFVEHL